jgi:PAS domain S-box-containing protein
MKDQYKTKHVLIQELASLRQRIEDLEKSEAERKRMEEELRLHGEILTYMVESVHLVRADDGVIVYTNKRFDSVFGYDQGELVGKHVSIVNAPGEKPPEAVANEIIRSLKQGGGVWSGEVHNIRKDGHSFWSYANVSTFKHTQYGEVWISVNRDITERKRTEEKLQASETKYRDLVENINDIIFTINKEGRFTYMSPVTEHVLGYSPVALIGHPFSELIYPEDLPLVITAFNNVQSGILKYHEYRVCNKSGDIRWIRSSSRPNCINGNVDGIKGIAIDITEQKLAEVELRTSHSQLRTLATRLQIIREEEMTLIAREIHDEMGGGLTGLKMDLSWLLRKVGDADPGEERANLMDKIQTANALIDHMISVVRRISTDLRPSVLDDLGLIAALEWQLSEFTSRTEITHEFTKTYEYVNMEENTAIAVFRIFQEALTNVARHSRATNVAVVLREGEGSLFGDESLVLEIRDNGRGITDEDILNPESLGLLGMKERVLAFSGEISICGAPGGGTTLILKIPLIQGETS